MCFAGIGTNQCLVLTKILLRHSSRGEALLELHAHLASIELAKPFDGPDGFCFPRHDKSGNAVVNDFRHRTGLECDNGRTDLLIRWRVSRETSRWCQTLCRTAMTCSVSI
jgi:hypothetical protein